MSSQPALQRTIEVKTGISWRSRWLELGLVLLVVVVPLVLASVNIYLFGFPALTAAQSDLKHVIGVISELAGLALVWYVLGRTQRTFSDLGLKWNAVDVGAGLLLAVVELFVTNLASSVLGKGYSYWTGAPYKSSDVMGYVFAGGIVWTLLLLLVVPFFEEIIVRGYFMTELAGLTGSMMLAVFASALLQASYHLYQGFIPAAVLFFGCFISAIYYASTKKLLPVIVAHGATDFLALALFLSKHHG